MNFSEENILNKNMNNKKNILFKFKSTFSIFIVSVAFLTIGFYYGVTSVFASTSSVSINQDFHYAWGENVGWIDFSQVKIDYASTTLSGYAYGENIGFISFNCENTNSCIDNNYVVANNNYLGVLGGYAWGENVGWIDFSNVVFATSTGIFSGYAYGENIGNIIFGEGEFDNNKVVASWIEPLSTSTPITSCGTIIHSGTYSLGADIVDTTGTCFTVLADDVIIEGLDPADHTTIHTVTGTGSGYSVDARGIKSGESGHSFTLQNIIFRNFSNGISADANALGNGNGGDVTITNSDIIGGLSTTGSGTGTDGAFVINQSFINIPSGYSWVSNDGGLENVWVFNGNSFNTGTIHGTAKFYGTSDMQGGSVSVCNFYEASRKTGGTCGSVYYLQPYYFSPTSDSLWSNPANWYWKTGNATTSVSGTSPSIPQAQDTVYLGGTPTGIDPTVLSVVYVATGTPNTGNFEVDLTDLAGPNTITNFYNGYNVGNVQGVLNLHNNLTLSAVKGSGAFDTNLVINFYGTSHNDVEGVFGVLNFYEQSYNDLNGTAVSTPNFYDSSYNLNAIQSAVFGGDSNNTGTTTTATFNGTSTNSGFVGTANFNDGSYNTGITNSATFNGESYNIGTSSIATFVGDLAENFYQSSVGFVSGVKTRLYNAIAPQINLTRSFIGSAWTVVADNTLVKLLYRNLINIFGANPSTTLVEQNGGIILRPLNPGVISTCGVLDVENGTYTLDTSESARSYFFNYNFDTCFIIRANGVTIEGAYMTVRTLSNSTSSTAVFATSTPSEDGSYNAFTNITVKNIRFAGFENALNANGSDNLSGAGGNGGVVSFATSTLNANILANGGNGTTNGGNGGSISISNVNARGFTASTTLSANGGDSTSCGNGGNAGYINTSRSGYNIVSVLAGNGSNEGCQGNSSVGNPGSSSGRHTDIGGNSVSNDPAGDASSALNSRSTSAVSSNSGSRSSNFVPGTINQIVLPIQDIKPIKLEKLPTFGTDKKGAFSFLLPLKIFLFASSNVSVLDSLKPYPKLQKYITDTLGFNTDQKLVALYKKPLKLDANAGDIMGIFKVISPKGSALVTTLNVDKKGDLSQHIKVNAKDNYQTLNIQLATTSVTAITGKLNDTNYIFTNNKTNITTTVNIPQKAGTYTFTTSASPLPLVIEVVSTNPTPNITSSTSAPSLWSRVKGWFGL